MIKKLLFFGTICLSSAGFAQSAMANLSFENWISGAPAGFIGIGTTQMTVGAQHLNNYMRVTSNGQSGATASGIAFIGSVGSGVFDGVPYTNKPVAFTGYYKATIMPLDTGYIGIDFSKNGNFTVLNATVNPGIEITTSANTWTSFSINLNYTAQSPDTIHIYIVANKTFGGSPAGPVGTIIDADNFGVVMASNIQKFEDYSILLSAYPNPTNDNFNIISKSTGAVKIEIYDLSGRMVESKDFESDKLSVDVRNYLPGMYLYKVFGNDENVLRIDKFSVTQ